jgi:hypothetical protein
MASRPVTQIYYYEINAVEDEKSDQIYWAIYGNRSVQDVKFGTDYRDLIRQAVQEGKLPGTISPAGADDEPRVRRLDLLAKKPRGRSRGADTARAYAFRLNARVEVDDEYVDLFFAKDRPVIPMPTNAGSDDSFIRKIHTYKEQGERRWASFVCDPHKIRNSELAKRVVELGKEHAAKRKQRGPSDAHPSLLTLPFTLNLVDSRLQAAPWVLDPLASLVALWKLSQDQSSDSRIGKEVADAPSVEGAGSINPAWGMLTHGGVHPDLMPFLVVEL